MLEGKTESKLPTNVQFTGISQLDNHAQAPKVEYSGGPLDNPSWQTNFWPQQKLLKFGFRTQATAPWSVEQSFILSAKFDCPVACQNISLLATAHDFEIGLLRQEPWPLRVTPFSLPIL